MRKKVLLIGVSTGGPALLKKMLLNISSLSYTIVIAQHMKEEVLPFFIEDLKEKSAVKIDATPLLVSFDEPSVIICTSSAVIQKKSNIFEIVSQKANQHYTPDINMLFISFANFTDVLDIEVLIMTGIGRDGTDGAKLLKSKGAKIYAQDEQSSPVFGMPKSVIESGIVDKVKSFDEILKCFSGL